MEKCKWSGDQRDENILSFEKDRDDGFSWPQRNYGCSFCNREFKSAQALGGHTNVHRRDRARMRLSSPNSLMDSNPNTSFSSSPCVAKFLPYHPSLTRVSIPPISASSNKELGLGSNPKEYDFSFDNVPIVECSQPQGEKNNVPMVDVGRTDGARVVRYSNEYNRLDLSMGFFEDAKDNQDLDLELRLGY